MTARYQPWVVTVTKFNTNVNHLQVASHKYNLLHVYYYQENESTMCICQKIHTMCICYEDIHVLRNKKNKKIKRNKILPLEMAIIFQT